MANRTHRWIPKMNIKMSGPHKRANSSEFMINILRRAREMLHDPCDFIHPKFENSLYFEKNRKEIASNKSIEEIQKVKGGESEFYMNKKEKNHVKIKRVDSFESIESVEEDYFRKDETNLLRSEYVILANASKYSKCINLNAKSYIISADKENIERLTEVLECLKNITRPEEWITFKIILFDQSIDVRHSLLCNDRCLEELETKPSEDSINSKLSFSTLTSHMSSAEADTKLKNNSIQKYRDSCLIAHQRLPIDVGVDPIAKCFENITKLVQDEIFSILKHVSTHVEELNHLITIFDMDKLDYNLSS